MRTIPAQELIDAVAEMVTRANYALGDGVLHAIEKARETESSPVGRDVLGQILQNAEISREGKFPICQDTGLAIFFVELGEDVRVDGALNAALAEGVRVGYGDGYLRNGVCDPFSRENTGDNTPVVIHVDLVPGDGLVIDFLAKGGGAENMSRAGVLTPAAGERA